MSLIGIYTSDETMTKLNWIIVADSCKSQTIDVWALKLMSLTSAIDSFPFILYFVLIKSQRESLSVALKWPKMTQKYIPSLGRLGLWYFGFQKIKPGPSIKENLNMQTVICKLCRKSYANKGMFSYVNNSYLTTYALCY